jgi:hypothetical protein
MRRRDFIHFIGGAAVALPRLVCAEDDWLPKHVLHASVGCFRNPSGVGYIRLP